MCRRANAPEVCIAIINISDGVEKLIDDLMDRSIDLSPIVSFVSDFFGDDMYGDNHHIMDIEEFATRDAFADEVTCRCHQANLVFTL